MRNRQVAFFSPESQCWDRRSPETTTVKEKGEEERKGRSAGEKERKGEGGKKESVGRWRVCQVHIEWLLLLQMALLPKAASFSSKVILFRHSFGIRACHSMRSESVMFLYRDSQRGTFGRESVTSTVAF
jgi:hypothetical protein